jgi:predicted molibdopterin-dependent oxidoreductase YjgC
MGIHGFAKRILKELESALTTRKKPVALHKKRVRRPRSNRRFPFLLLPETSLFSYRGISLLDTTSDMRRIATQDTILIHPTDAKELKIKDGEPILIRSEFGKGTVRVNLSEDVARGTLRLPLSGLTGFPFFENGVPGPTCVPVNVRKRR